MIVVPILVPIGLYFSIPYIMHYFTGRRPQSQFLLVVAGLLYFISWYLPSPLIEGENTSFTTHIVGGGIFSGILWVYLKDHLKWKLDWLADYLGLFVLVSTFGVLNELAELLLIQLDIVNFGLTDTSGDFVANTLGATLFWLVYRLFSRERRYHEK